MAEMQTSSLVKAKLKEDNININERPFAIQSNKRSQQLNDLIQKYAMELGISVADVENAIENLSLESDEGKTAQAVKESTEEFPSASSSETWDPSDYFQPTSESLMQAIIDADTDLLNRSLENEIRIVLIGKTGSGKSATGNSILGSKQFESKASSKSVTHAISVGKAERFRKKLLVVDTPGIFDTDVENDKTLNEIGKCIGVSAPGIHAALLITTIGRHSPEEQETFRLFMKQFGDDVSKYSILVFTRADELDEEADAFDEYLEESHDSIKNLLQKLNGRKFLINNKWEENAKQQQIQVLIDMITDMVKENNGAYYTNEMYLKAEEMIRQEINRRKLEEERKKEKEKQKIIAPFVQKLEERDQQIMDLEMRHKLAATKLDTLTKEVEEERRKLSNLQKTQNEIDEERKIHLATVASYRDQIASMEAEVEGRLEAHEIALTTTLQANEDNQNIIQALLEKIQKEEESKRQFEDEAVRQRDKVKAFEDEIRSRHERETEMRSRIRKEIETDMHGKAMPEKERKGSACAIS